MLVIYCRKQLAVMITEINVEMKAEVYTVEEREDTALEVGSCSLLVYVR
jgi:hypothetical protein